MSNHPDARPLSPSADLVHRATGQSPYPDKIFGSSGNKAAFSQEEVLKYAGRGNREASVLVWQLQNIMEAIRERRVDPEQMEFIVNAGSPCQSGRIYMVSMTKPMRALLRIYHHRAEDRWEYTIDRAGDLPMSPSEEEMSMGLEEVKEHKERGRRPKRILDI